MGHSAPPLALQGDCAMHTHLLRKLRSFAHHPRLPLARPLMKVQPLAMAFLVELDVLVRGMVEGESLLRVGAGSLSQVTKIILVFWPLLR